jgi:hypothetical protein
MNYEKKYKQLHKFITDLYPHMSEYCKEKVEGFFPELAESEDERIRKWCISHFKAAFRVTKDNAEYQEYLNKKVIPWLEKQGESFTKKEVEYAKVTPKFKVGDWLQYRSAEPFLVEEITEQGYINGNSCLPFEWENEIHLWTVQDAKEGDVLACNEEILLFKSFSAQGRISLYCWYNGQTKNFHSKEVNNTSLTTRNKIFPATKEQREFLFAKMKEAGYEWDALNKQLISSTDPKYRG